MEQEGVVKKINSNMATVAFIKKSGCGGACSSCKGGCPKDTILMDIENTADAKIGEKVIVEIENDTFKRLTFLAYVFPSIITLIALSISMVIFKANNFKYYELYSVIVAIIAMVLSFKISKKLNKHDDNYVFKMKSRIKNF